MPFGAAMSLSRIRVYVLGLIITTLIMAAVFGAIYIFINEISLLYVVTAFAAILAVWGINTYYLVRIIDEEERVEAGHGEG